MCWLNLLWWHNASLWGPQKSLVFIIKYCNDTMEHFHTQNSIVVTQWSVWLFSALFYWLNELEISHGILWRWQTLCWNVQWHWHKASLQTHIWALSWQNSASLKDNGVFWNHKAQYNNSSLKCYCWIIFWACGIL